MGTLWRYYLDTAEKIVANAYSGIETGRDWTERREEIHDQFMKSMGLDPLPSRAGLKVVDSGEFSGKGYKARKIAYELLPDCWGTAVVYYPDPLPAEKLPGVLYVSGHGSIGLLHYQPHTIMWARRGYVCLAFDTIEQHDCGGNHHGTLSRQRYDWISMGYTAAGGEMWNSMRALDMLCSLPEVDTDRIGATGMSGGGSHSFFLTVADERVRAVATACGVPLQNYALAHRHFQAHCDCTHPINLFMNSMGEYAGLIAPRPALYCFASKDGLYSVPEYRLLVEQAAKAYSMLGCEENCRLFEYDAHHAYTTESIKLINQWFDQHVAGAEHPDADIGEVESSERELTVFNGKPPVGNRMHLLPELLSLRGSLELPDGMSEWKVTKKKALARLRKEAFCALDTIEEKMEVETQGLWINRKEEGGRLLERQYNSYSGVVGGMEISILGVTSYHDAGRFVVALAGPDESAYDARARVFPYVESSGMFTVEGRTGGFNGYHGKMEGDLLRGGALIGLSPVVVMVKDLLLTLDFLLDLPYMVDQKVFLCGKGDQGVACVYAALFDERVAGVIAEDLPSTHTQGAHIPGVMRVMDLDHAIGLLAPRPVGLVNQAVSRNNWSARAFERLGCPQRKVAGRSMEIVMKAVLTL